MHTPTHVLAAHTDTDTALIYTLALTLLAHVLRCFPRIPGAWANAVVESVAGQEQTRAAGDRIESFKDSFNSLSEKWTRCVCICR